MKTPIGQTLPEWPLDAPQQPLTPMIPWTPSKFPPFIELAVAAPPGFDGHIPLSLTMDGQTKLVIVRKSVAASMIAELARALANSP